MRYCGREFSLDDFDIIRQIIKSCPDKGRREVSRQVCSRLSWLKPDGGLKDMSCRVAMLRMEKDGLITLPPAKRCNASMSKKRIQRTLFGEPKPEIVTPAGKLNLCLEIIEDKFSSLLWNELIDRYHYLGHKPLPGAQIGQNRLLAPTILWDSPIYHPHINHHKLLLRIHLTNLLM